jgi:hypothetical protein
MRLLAIAALALFAVSAEARAGSSGFGDIWPWCLYHAMVGGVNCGFVSEAQCRAGKTGNADMCMPNAMFDPSRYAPRPAKRERKG